MKLLCKDRKLYMTVSPQERLECIPYIYGAKYDSITGSWVAPIGSLLTIMTVFNECNPVDKATDNIFEIALNTLNNIAELKKSIITKKEIKNEEFPFLMSHQAVCNKLAKAKRRYAYFLDTGTGKTIASLSIIQNSIDSNSTKWLIICPKSIIKTAWLADCEQFFPNINMLPLKAGMTKKEIKEYANKFVTDGNTINKVEELFQYVDCVVTNPEQFKKYYKTNSFKEFDGLIVDESTMIKNVKAQITKFVYDFSKTCSRCYILSGKPAPNTPLDYFNQIKVVDPYVFGLSYTRFRDNFFYQADYFGYDWRMQEDKKELFSSLLDLCSIFVSKSDCLDLPPKTYQRREVELSSDTMAHYKSMEKEQLVCLQDRDIPASNKLASLMKLRQISSGFIIDTEEQVITSLDNAKVNELEKVLEELGDEKAIIWINFKEEARVIEEMMQKKGYTYVTAYQGTKDVDDSINKFKSNEAQFIIAHPKTLKYGVTFTGSSMKKNCTYAIYYSLSYSFEDYYQSHDRIYRKGQADPCTFIFLLSKDTIDNNLYWCLQNKGTSAQLIEDMVKELSSKYE